jgi:hypothetical protein
VPFVLQRKKIFGQAPMDSRSPQPPARPPQHHPAGQKTAVDCKAVAQLRKKPTAPPIYRPQPVPKVLQKKESPTAKHDPKHGAVIQPRSQRQPPVPTSPVSRSVIQRSNLLYVSLRVAKRYEIKRQSSGGKFYLYLVEEGSSNPLANMRYKFYNDGSAVMEHVEAYGMPSGTRAGYLLFYVFADHAMKAGIKTVGIGTGVDERSVTRNIEEARSSSNRKALEESNRNMAAVHIYKEFGFDATDAVTLSNSSRTVQQVLTIATQKCGGFWRIQPNYRFFIQGFRRLIAQITAPLPPDNQVFNLPNSITDDDL